MNKYTSNLFMSIRLHWYFRQRMGSSLLMLILLKSYHYIFHSACMLGSNKIQVTILWMLVLFPIFQVPCTTMCFPFVRGKISKFWTSQQTFLKGINQSVIVLQSFQFQKFYDASETRRKRRFPALMCHAPNTLSSFLDFFKGENHSLSN